MAYWHASSSTEAEAVNLFSVPLQSLNPLGYFVFYAKDVAVRYGHRRCCSKPNTSGVFYLLEVGLGMVETLQTGGSAPNSQVFNGFLLQSHEKLKTLLGKEPAKPATLLVAAYSILQSQHQFKAVSIFVPEEFISGGSGGHIAYPLQHWMAIILKDRLTKPLKPVGGAEMQACAKQVDS